MGLLRLGVKMGQGAQQEPIYGCSAEVFVEIQHTVYHH